MGFELDLYGEFGDNSGSANDFPDEQKLMLLADWFDKKDELEGSNETEVQDDLRRLAHELWLLRYRQEKLVDTVERLRRHQGLNEYEHASWCDFGMAREATCLCGNRLMMALF